MKEVNAQNMTLNGTQQSNQTQRQQSNQTGLANFGEAIAKAIYEKLGIVVSYDDGTSDNATVHCVIRGTLFGKIFDTITRQLVKIA